ncbi:WXG100 family type VII secretion target [Nonomuraea sp. NBC_00507]|uniref:WXG100 family type VII secretion target n=1 Tax=unclassified Nonomuraea TaxID=2593643 RepID=UPI00273BB12A|nr:MULTISPECIES: WXG100 family type VII secretion target [unclassified Nonomuraea]MDP4506629.1 WXG100 family type VII secretion target [Nonomuraea sp. G32]
MPAEDIFDITKVNFAGLGEGEDAFARAFNDMVTTLDTLERDLLAKSAIWQGEAKTVFDEVRALWKSEANDMSQFIDLMKQNINITNMNMQQVERINAQIFDGR